MGAHAVYSKISALQKVIIYRSSQDLYQQRKNSVCQAASLSSKSQQGNELSQYPVLGVEISKRTLRVRRDLVAGK